MAFYEQLSKYTYRLTVCQGYDSNGKKLRKRKTIKLSDKLTDKQLEKELTRQLILFEKVVNDGTYLNGESVSFKEFVDIWLKDYAAENLAVSTLVSYKTKLRERIIPAIGHIKLAKLQPTHILHFYNSLKDENIRLDGRYTPTERLKTVLAPYTAKQLENITGISYKTCQRLQLLEGTNKSTAERLCDTLHLNINKMFTYKVRRTLSEKSIRSHIGIIGSILSTAVKWNIIVDNPVRRVDMKKVPRKSVKYYDDKQIAIMLNLLEKEPLMFRTMIYLTLDIGLRKGELTGLCWSDVNFEESTVNINKQRHYVMGYGTFEDKPKTEAGIRIVTVSKTVCRLLKAYKNYQNRNRLKFGTAWHNTPYIFVLEDGKEISPHLPYKWFTKFLERNNLPKITFHQLRHTNASLMISAGEDIVTVSGRLGRSDKNITLNTYSHIIKSKEAQVANKMEEFYTRLKKCKLL